MMPSSPSFLLSLLFFSGFLISTILSKEVVVVVGEGFLSHPRLPPSESAWEAPSPSISKELVASEGLGSPPPLPSRGPAARSLLFSNPDKHDKYLLASSDGTIYLVGARGEVQWSFSTGLPQAISNHYSGGSYVYSGEDGELYEFNENFGTRKLNMKVKEYVYRTPEIKGSVVTVGSKTTTIFHADAGSGKLFHMNHLPVIWPAVWVTNNEDKGVLSKLDTDGSARNANVITIIRTDFTLSSSDQGKLLWDTRFAYISAYISGYGSGLPPNTVDGLDSLPSCQRNIPVYLIKFDKPTEANYEGDMPPLASHFQNARNLNMQDIKQISFNMPENSCKAANSCLLGMVDAAKQNITELFPGVIFHLASRVQNLRILGIDDQMAIETSQNSCEAANSCLVGIDIAAKENVAESSPKVANRVSAWYLILPFLILLVMLFALRYLKLREPVKIDKQSTDLRRGQPVVSKKRKTRKAGNNKNSSVFNNHERHSSSENENAETNGHKQSQIYDRYLMDLTNAVDAGDGRRVGRLFVSNSEIAKGSNGTVILEGVYDGRPVAVKRLLRSHHDVAIKEIQNLIASDQHQNIVRWYGVEEDLDFVYISLERCTCSLADLIQLCSDFSSHPTLVGNPASESINGYKIRLDSVKGIDKDLELWRPNGFPSSQLLKLMRDMVTGLAHLHELGMIHRDLKPQNVLISSDRILYAKISDMGISKRLLEGMSSLSHHATGLGSSGWQAPEQLLNGRQTRAVDLFSLGCVLFFCITKGNHPFGRYFERDSNILNNRIDLFLVDHIPEAVHLFSLLLDPKPKLRPNAVEVLSHPLFWNSEMRISFFRDTSDRVELQDRENESELLKALESVSPVAFGGKWGEKLDVAFITDMGRYRRYKFDSMRDLLRVMRNKLNHYMELPKELQEILGPVPEGFDSYFTHRFPKLLIEVYKVVFRYCREEACFKKYFKINLI